MSATGVAARLARREVVRRPWRSAVVFLLVLIPVVVLTAVVVMMRTEDRAPIERFAETAGTEDLRWSSGVYDLDPTWRRVHLYTAADSRPLGALARTLPAESHVVTYETGHARLRTVDRDRRYATISSRPLDDPISAGLVRRLDGRVPAAADEVLLTPRLAEGLSVAVGDTLQLDRPAAFTATVVGIGEWGAHLDELTMAVHSDEVVSALTDYTSRHTLVDLPAEASNDPDLLFPFLDAGAQSRVQPPGWSGVVAPESDFPAQTAIVWTWIGGAVAFTILGVVIAAAFAVTARRQLLLLGQLMSNGADQRTVRSALFLQGTVVGLVGGLVGMVVAVAALHLFQPLVEQVVGRRLSGYDVRIGDLLPIWIIATVAATGAAVIPARAATQTTVLQALNGRRPIGPYPGRLVARGALAVVAGLLLLAVATAGAAAARNDDATLFVLTGIAGSLAVLLGTCAMTPAIVARLEPLAGPLRGTARLAARSIARQRTRTGAVVAAIAVVAAGAVAGSAAWLTSEERVERLTIDRTLPDDLVVVHYRQYRLPADLDVEPAETITTEPPAELVAELRAIVPGLQRVPLEVAIAARPGDETIEMQGSVLQVVDDTYRATFEVSPTVSDALDRGLVAAFEWTGFGDADAESARQIPVFDVRGRDWGYVDAIRFDRREGDHTGRSFISADRADELGLIRRPAPATFQAPEALTGDQRDRLADLADDAYFDYGASSEWEAGAEFTEVWIDHPHERFETSSALVTASIVSVATVFTLAVVALGLALSAAETRDERDVLAAVGAPPKALRRLAGAKAAVLSIVGTLVGIPLGFVPVWVVLRAGSVDSVVGYAPVFPTIQVFLLIIAVPLVATIATFAASSVALRLRPVTASSMAFD